jgi:biotin carboxyl carrier protein
MHEQKLVEVSITEELLEQTAAAYRQAGKTTQAQVLTDDLAVLRAMESEAEAFGQAVGLNSASTFECIVDGTNHYFMEVNTRIQVEHRVTEMVYALRFHSPERPEDYFQVDSLVEAMLWMAAHGDALPRPERVPRQPSGAEVRINATNDALQPHAGGVVQYWSPPIEHEIRDDQGIGIPNPDTDQFMPYNLAGAYDSNAALVVTYGTDRLETYQRMAEILRRTEIRGDDVITNATFHYGLIHWMIGTDAMVKPGTRFVQAYLAAVGTLQQAAANLDLDSAWQFFLAAAQEQGKPAAAALEAKTTLLQRPMRRLFSKAHLLAGWLAPRPQRRFILADGCVSWQQNPLAVLQQLYAYLHLEEKPGVSPQAQIWEHDSALLSAGLAFYRDLDERLGRALPWAELDALLAQDKPPQGTPAAAWPAVQAAHRGHQLGLDLLKLPVLCGEDAGFYALACDERLEPIVDERLYDAALLKQAQAALAPPPPASSNEILAWTGGTFYARPSPDAPTYVSEGSHVEAGEVVGLLEVMKMFNPVRAEFAGTIKTVHLSGDQGVIVAKGQALYEMTPDVPPTTVPAEALAAQRTRQTLALLERC